MTQQCKWHEAWRGQCKRDADNAEFCEEHKNEKCSSCGALATHSCEETGQFVCGAPLCDECEHVTVPAGHNGGVGFNACELPEGLNRHVKKTEQKYKSWTARPESCLDCEEQSCLECETAKV